MKFVQDWFGFSQFIPHPTNEFHPGNRFRVYVEIENPTIRQIPDGFNVAVAISYEIRNEHASIVAREDVGKPEKQTFSRLRDFCLEVPGTIPASLAPGQYFLRVSITDLNDPSMRFAEEQIPFRVVPATR